MSQSSDTTATRYPEGAVSRLSRFLELRPEARGDNVVALTPDASTREYFRIPWNRSTAIAAVYSEKIDPASHSFLDVTKLFEESGLPVPCLLAVDPELGVIAQEDLGDRQLKDVVNGDVETSEMYLQHAISLIARIQAATNRAFESKSVASRLAFDEEKLNWELDFFYIHYVSRLRKWKFSDREDAEVRSDLVALARELAERPRVLCHRDYHVANLMVDPNERLRIVDYQDARMGPASYDLVSLLLDRRTCCPEPEEIAERKKYFLEQIVAVGLPPVDASSFDYEFDLMTVQRGLKAIGTFSNQTLCGRGHVYARFINPTFEIVNDALNRLGRLPSLKGLVEQSLADSFSWQ
jgi:aminoglycoside/choline kinase family phosphotransferase